MNVKMSHLDDKGQCRSLGTEPMDWGVTRTRGEGKEVEDELGPLTVPSARAEITFPRADSDLLMFFASSRTAPSAPVLLTCTEEKYRTSVSGRGEGWPHPPT